jgi:hypothetical protein
LSGAGGTGTTDDFAESNDPTCREVKSCAMNNCGALNSCSAANGTAPRCAAPAASPRHADSIRTASARTDRAPSPYESCNCLTIVAEVARSPLPVASVKLR